MFEFLLYGPHSRPACQRAISQPQMPHKSVYQEFFQFTGSFITLAYIQAVIFGQKPLEHLSIPI